MANQRIFLAQGLSLNGVAVGGLSTIAFNAAYTSVVESSPDGAVGVEDVDRGGLRVGVSIRSTDVAKINAILDAAPGATTFSGKESGTSTYQDRAVSGIVLNRASLDLSRDADGTLQLDGVVRAADPSDTLATIIGVTGAQTPGPALTYPARLYRPHAASFDPVGVPAAIAPLHTQSVRLSLDAPVFEDFADDDVSLAAVDRGEWGAPTVSLTHRDATPVAPGDKQAALLDAVRGVLTVELKGRAGAADKLLTINNLLWSGGDENHQREYTDFTLNGLCGWRETGPIIYTLNGAPKLFSIA